MPPPSVSLPRESTHPGFWGAPTASVDWCEANYTHSHYVAEPFNAGSSLALVAVGVLGAIRHWRVLERRFLLVFGSVALVGVGSVAFHSTLLFELQMLDELPMLYTATLLAYILLEDGRDPRYGHWLPIGLGCYAAFATYVAVFTRGSAQFWAFQGTFVVLEVFGLYRTYLLYRKSKDTSQRRVFEVGMASYALAVTLWLLDTGLCQTVVSAFAAVGLPNLQLHAWWHVLVAAGLYALIVVIAYHRQCVLGTPLSWQRRGPFVHLAPLAPPRSGL